jgi:hypothetical protein
MLFPDDEARALLKESLVGLQKDQSLRIWVRLDTYPLADLPWEYAHVPPIGFLAIDERVSLVRSLILKPAAPCRFEPVADGRASVLIVSANPLGPGGEKLSLEKEVAEISSALEEVPGVRITHCSLPTTEKLIDDVQKCKPHILHFAGHGRFEGKPGAQYLTEVGKGSLMLLDSDGREYPLAADSLHVLLKAQPVRLAVLAACNTGKVGEQDALNDWTGIAPALVQAGIPAVVAMQYPIGDKHACDFSRAFYRSLAAGESIDLAMYKGRVQIRVPSGGDERDWGVPVLYLHISAGDGVIFPNPFVSGTRAETFPAGHLKEPPPISPDQLKQMKKDVKQVDAYVELFSETEDLPMKLEKFLKELKELKDTLGRMPGLDGDWAEYWSDVRTDLPKQFGPLGNSLRPYMQHLEEGQPLYRAEDQDPVAGYSAKLTKAHKAAQDAAKRIVQCCREAVLGATPANQQKKATRAVNELREAVLEIVAQVIDVRGELYDSIKDLVKELAKNYG